MNKAISILLFSLLTTSLFGQSALQGAWQLSNGGPDTETVVIYSDDYFMFAQYHTNGDFIEAGGGSYQLNGDNYEQMLDFHTKDTARIRQPENLSFEVQNNQLILAVSEGDSQTWERIDASTTPLTGAWRFGARVDENGVAGNRRGPGPRQTMKILSGSRFQWAAFNYETKEFSGTGGGTYLATDGKYTENIEFFSRDNDRVGQSLTFQYDRKEDDWFHKGQSSTGKPLHEVWEKVE